MYGIEVLLIFGILIGVVWSVYNYGIMKGRHEARMGVLRVLDKMNKESKSTTVIIALGKLQAEWDRVDWRVKE